MYHVLGLTNKCTEDASIMPTPREVYSKGDPHGFMYRITGDTLFCVTLSSTNHVSDTSMTMCITGIQDNRNTKSDQ